jgi:lysophospholipase
LAETAHLAGRAAPSLPCVTFLGTNERIVDIPRIEARMEGWKGSTFEKIEGGEHEVLMEQPHMRDPIFDHLAKHFLETVTR